ncbi:MAG: Na+/H+ antiporter subunit D [Acidobacteriota bacterium]|nr:Na+/H+ antiporter subunit D [Acidobacteriota bacterium]
MIDLLLFLPITVPLATALLSVIVRDRARTSAFVGVVGAGVLLVVNLVLLVRVQDLGILVARPGNWDAPFGITLVADYLSAAMLAITGLIGLAVSVYALTDTAERYRHKNFFALFHFLLMGVCGAFLAGDLFNLYVWFEVMLISSFVLLTLDRSREQLVGAVQYVTINLVSSVIFLAGLGLLYGNTGTLNMADLAQKLTLSEDAMLILSSSVFFLIAFGIKAGLFPLFFWLPGSYHTPPIAVAALFSGLLTKVGVYALIRSFTLIFTQDQGLTGLLLPAIAGATMVAGVLGAVAQSDIRKILSFHIISQIGYMIMGLALMTPLALAGSIFYLIHHIVVKTNLFLIAGMIARAGRGFHLSKLGGLLNAKPYLALLFLIPAFSLAGIPPLSGFFSKFIIIRAGLETGDIALVVTALVVGVLTLISMTKIWQEAFWKAQPEHDEDDQPKKSVGVAQWVPVAALAVITVIIGIAAEPVMNFAETAATQLLDPAAYIAAVLGGQP